MDTLSNESTSKVLKTEYGVQGTPELLPVSDGLLRTRIIAMFIKYVLISSYIIREIAPLSLMLIAPSEENKTRILLCFKNFKRAKIIENLSAKPLNDLIKKQEDKQSIFHIIILDFIRTLQHKASVVDAVIGTLLNLIDEGVKDSLFYGQTLNLKRRISIGVITGITPPLFKQHFIKWNENGTITRFFFVTYHYSKSTCSEINAYISKDLPIIVNKTITKIKQRGQREITISKDISAAISLVSDEVTERLLKFHVTRHVGKSSYQVYLDMRGFRLHKMLRLLAQCIAYDRNRDFVNYEDLVTLKEICEFIRLPADSIEDGSKEI